MVEIALHEIGVIERKQECCMMIEVCTSTSTYFSIYLHSYYIIYTMVMVNQEHIRL